MNGPADQVCRGPLTHPSPAGSIRGISGNLHKTDAGPHLKRSPFPEEPEIAEGAYDDLTDLLRFVEHAVVQQKPEFVAAEPSERIPLPEFSGEQPFDLLQQLVSRLVTGRVVDQLEQIEIEVTESMMRPVLFGACHRPVQ